MNKNTEQDWSSALREISTDELKQATLALGLKLSTVDLSWDTFCVQFTTALERFQAANIDITTFVILKDMLEQTKKEVFDLKHSHYLALNQLLQYRQEEDFNAYQKRKKRSKKEQPTKASKQSSETKE